MTDQEKNNNNSDPSKSGVIESLINLGTATTKMTIDQMQNAFSAIVHPVAAMEHVKDTMNSLSEAMNNASSSGPRVSEPVPLADDLRGAATGMEHLSDNAPMPKARAHSAGGHAINRRKS